MSEIFLPSCKIKAAYPGESARLAGYMEKKTGTVPAGCCRLNYNKFNNSDTITVICNNCFHIVTESSKAEKIRFVWDVIDQDSDFDFPDYHRERMTIQDCWITNCDRHLQDTVRSLMKKMNIQIVEIEKKFEKSDYCGTNLVNHPSKSNLELAPVLWGERMKEFSRMIPPEKQKEYFEGYCKQFTTEKVVCYCRSCAAGINLGGRKGLHLIELLFPEKL